MRLPNPGRLKITSAKTAPPSSSPTPMPKIAQCRDAGGLEGVFQQDHPFRQAIGAHGADIGLVQHLQQRGAQQPGDIADPNQRQARLPARPRCQSWSRSPLPAPSTGNQGEPEGEDQQQEDGIDEARRRDEADAEEGDRLIDRPARLEGAERAKRYADHDGQQDRRHRQQRRIRQGLGDDLADRPAR